ncbi:hypothetical protein Y032_0010g1115 [Ancylostoma ceylanicum]|uniref:Uncharacterized protein n=1 Tax=Ancylostoma ceylanicum TaxID=53326 RepID=A0A016VH58_9BILA|nr:hypothetical protein Y032_0010g1115 [Ancylostoma ceylanicum]
MAYRVSSVLKMAGYRSHGARGAPVPSTARNTEIRDHQWREVVLAGSSVKSAKDVGPSIQKALSIVGKPWVRRVRRSSITYKIPCRGFVEGVPVRFSSSSGL